MDLSSAVPASQPALVDEWLAYRTPAELASTTWLVVINGVYFDVRRDGADLVFERKAQAGVSGLASPLSRERRLPGT